MEQCKSNDSDNAQFIKLPSCFGLAKFESGEAMSK